MTEDSILSRIRATLQTCDLLTEAEAFDLASRLVQLGKRMVRRGLPVGRAAGLTMDLVMMGYGAEQVVTAQVCPVDPPVLPEEWIKAGREDAANRQAA